MIGANGLSIRAFFFLGLTESWEERRLFFCPLEDGLLDFDDAWLCLILL